ncbi:MAG: hypothetical protein RL563_2824 [Pseudomonadota bacterium]
MICLRLLILIVASLLSTPLLAVDLTGTWQGNFTCSGFNGRKFNYVEKNHTLQISQSDSALAAKWLEEKTDFSGFVIEDEKTPQTKGQVALANCKSKADLTVDSELANLNVVINRPRGIGQLTGISIYTLPSVGQGNVVGQCKWNFKLVDTEDPQLSSVCP